MASSKLAEAEIQRMTIICINHRTFLDDKISIRVNPKRTGFYFMNDGKVSPVWIFEDVGIGWICGGRCISICIKVKGNGSISFLFIETEVIHRRYTKFGKNIHFWTFWGRSIRVRHYPERKGIVFRETNGTKINSARCAIELKGTGEFTFAPSRVFTHCGQTEKCSRVSSLFIVGFGIFRFIKFPVGSEVFVLSNQQSCDIFIFNFVIER